MQVIAVLKGCLAAYLIGVLAAWIGFLESYWNGTLHVFGPWSSLVISVGYGALLAVPISILVLLIWLVLAWRKIKVVWFAAPLCASAFTGLAFTSIDGLGHLAISAAFGLLCGSIFWLAAFGRIKYVSMRLRS